MLWDARSTGRPILPIVVEGTARALPKKGIVLQGRHRISVDVLEEIPPTEFKDLETPELSRMVRERIASHLASLRSESGTPRAD